MMQFSNLLPLPLALVATTTARPSPQPTLVEKDDWPSFPWHDLFYLKTKVINGGNESMDGLYVYAYLTGTVFFYYTAVAIMPLFPFYHPSDSGLMPGLIQVLVSAMLR